MKKGLGGRTLALVRFILVPILVAPIVYALYERWLDVRVVLQTTDWRLVLLGLLVLILVEPLMGLISWIVLFYLNQRFSFLRITSIYFISQAAKYLPGGIWAFPGRIVGYQAIGVKGSASMISMVREISVLFTGAALVGLLGMLRGWIIADWVRFSIIAGVIASVLAIALIQFPGFWHWLSNAPLLKRVGIIDQDVRAAGISINWLPGALLVSVAFWLLTGIAFHTVALGVSPLAAGISWLDAASIFSIAWCAGFVVVLAPAGLGIRESVLAAVLLGYMPLGDALGIALVARLWWTVAEAVLIVAAVIEVAATRGTRTGVHGQDIGEPDQDQYRTIKKL